SPGEPNAPTRVLRQFLPPQDGGAGSPVPYLLGQLSGYAPPGDAQAAIQMPRRAFYELDLAPWETLPASIRRLPYYSDLGSRPRMAFMARFVEFYTQPGQPRDLLLRGRLDEAVNALVAQRDMIEQSRKEVQAAPNLEEGIGEWSRQAVEIQADYLRAKNAAARNPAAADQLKGATENIEAMWKAAQTPRALRLMTAMAE